MLQLLGDFVPPSSYPTGALPLDSTGFDPQRKFNKSSTGYANACLYASICISPEKCNGCASFSCIYYDEISGKFQENALALHDLQSVRVALSDTGY